jgi:hypothetical protein
MVRDALGPLAVFFAGWKLVGLAAGSSITSSHRRGRGQLVKLLASFPPVAELGFDRNELEALRTLRGKISHAASHTGSSELARSGG